MKNKSINLGLVAAISPIPLLIVSVLWSWLWSFGVGMGLLNYDTIPQWILIISMTPLLISPMLGVIGAIHGIVNIREGLSFVGIILSIICLVENAALIYGMYYLGSVY